MKFSLEISFSDFYGSRTHDWYQFITVFQRNESFFSRKFREFQAKNDKSCTDNLKTDISLNSFKIL